MTDTAEFAVSVPHPVKINKMGSKLIRMNFLTSFFITLYNTPLRPIVSYFYLAALKKPRAASTRRRDVSSPPHIKFCSIRWWARTDKIRGPRAYESPALDQLSYGPLRLAPKAGLEPHNLRFRRPLLYPIELLRQLRSPLIWQHCKIRQKATAQ